MLRRTNKELATREATPRSLFEDFDRIFENFRTGLEDMFWTPSVAPLTPWATGVRAPAVDIRDAGNEIVVTAELPGVSKDGLDINVSEDGVEIRAEAREERKEEDEGYYYQERTQSAWYRRLPFPTEVVPDKADAELRDGVLTLRVQKKEPTPARKTQKVRVK